MWNFDNSYLRLPDFFYHQVKPTAVREPAVAIFNLKLAQELGLEAAVDVFAGNEIPSGAVPLAQAYAGHQFGHFTRLGDGRALLLGEQVAPDGRRWDIQLKGSGPTPFSRRGDGRAALGPMLREYIISEAMHALGVPTTRSLAVVTTGERVQRDELQKGAILTRVASSHIRVGTFAYARAFGDSEKVKTLADYTIQRHYSEILAGENIYLQLLKKVCERQAALIAKWMAVGFIHGVMNTDNMAISGETIDYGPCAFLDEYDPAKVFSSIDTHGRYAYGNQPNIAQWNLARFAEILLPLFSTDSKTSMAQAEQALDSFAESFNKQWLGCMRAKLGLLTVESDDGDLAKDLLVLMQKYKADYTNTFLALTLKTQEDWMNQEPFQLWQKKWLERLDRQEMPTDAAYEIMRRSNPVLIPRNHRVEEALLAAETSGDYASAKNLVRALARPYDSDQLEFIGYRQPPTPSERVCQTFCGT